jgi:hypothetical protein
MTRTPNHDFEGSRGEFLKHLLEQGEEPAFIRRAKAVDEAWNELLDRCQTQRNDMLRWPRMRLAELARKVGGDWSRLAPLVANGVQVSVMERLHHEWHTQEPSDARSATPWSTLSGLLADFVNSVERFNALWRKHLQDFDLRSINALRADYNRYYPAEKAAAFDSEDIERLGFAPLAPASVEDLLVKYPLIELQTVRP